MGKAVLGAVATLVMLGIGLFWLQGRASVDRGAPPPFVQPLATSTALPAADLADAKGVAPPGATELTREQKRFARYDHNSDGIITRNEMLSTRTKPAKKTKCRC
ncbi:hypothetical protein GRI58_06730 [Porphyrobacter algicida]|uniref:EF-hand domain-containing protein n=1 Tax=Qipengyuania algicida TaxID=1836209 RepID=A0A845AI61_9SPHN|nr:hypothetical protein [Qipengyuania algicida]MXP28515.1 hypothetical protein [Qipengyuania algicida]